MWIIVLSLNGGVVNKKFENSKAVYNGIVDNNDNRLNNNEFVNKIFSINGTHCVILWILRIWSTLKVLAILTPAVVTLLLLWTIFISRWSVIQITSVWYQFIETEDKSTTKEFSFLRTIKKGRKFLV